MDITTIAAQALGFLTPFLTKGGEELASGMGKDLWEVIKKPFTSDKEKKLVANIQANPADPKQQGALEYKLSEKLEEDPALLAALLAIIQKLQDHPPGHTINIHQTHSGSGDNIGGNKITNNKI